MLTWVRPWIAALGCVAAVSAGAAMVPPALERPALAVRAPERAVLLAVAAAGPRLVAVGERGIVALSDDQGQRWRQARSVPTSVSLTALRFVDALRGWAVGHAGVILHTTDGGETWTRQADGRSLAQAALNAAARTPGDAQVRLAQQLVDDGADKPLLDLHFYDANRGVVAGAYGMFFETTDGGKTWNSAMDRIVNPKALHINAMRADGNALYLAGEQGLLLRSDDQGKTFRPLTSPYAGTWFTLAVPRPGTVLAAGLRGNAFISGDQGDNWSRLESAAQASYVSAAELPGDEVILANQAGQLLRSRADDALKVLPLPPLPPVSAILPLAEGALLAVGFTGALRLPGPAVSPVAQGAVK
ncbi:MAG: YCF48-related protein [Rhodoferax sp.]|uniref:WD40/YVTN/BNR-like repeat-containing protein n=1 Tax=Rhodoferax sp. TaxID=50421 RepID=UPI00273347E2|nr:YCF48-related protein [Rhodoferax sp.]MDP2679096.1 YCF48-related protein [Rhodoferax sp.]